MLQNGETVLKKRHVPSAAEAAWYQLAQWGELAPRKASGQNVLDRDL